MANEKLSDKEVRDIISRFARDRENEFVGKQNLVVASRQFSNAVEAGFDIIDRASAAAETLRTLEAEISQKQAQLKSLEARASETAASFKPQMTQLSDREKAVASREAEVAAREQRCTVREDRLRTIGGHLSSFNEDS